MRNKSRNIIHTKVALFKKKVRIKMKYYLNEKTSTLHKINGCCHSKHIPKDAKCFETEDEAIKEKSKYFKPCKLCFKEKK